MSTIICIASGPSLTTDDVEACRGHRVIVCNTSFRICPWAENMIAVDFSWWREFAKEAESFTGAKWTTSTRAREDYGLNYMRHSAAQGLSREHGVINGGGNTGQAAVNLAYHLGAKRIVLLGYDMQRTGKRSHWHGDYKRLSNGNAFTLWIRRIDRMFNDLQTAGVQIVNATRETAIKSIPRMSLDEVLR